MAKGAARKKGTADEPKFERLVVGFPPDELAQLRELAEAWDRPLAWCVRRAVRTWIEAKDE